MEVVLHQHPSVPTQPRNTVTTSEVFDALCAHLDADPTGDRAFRLLTLLAINNPDALRDTIATAERLYPTT